MTARLAPERHLHGALSFRGSLEVRAVESEALRGNRAGDPALRELPVYVPPPDCGPPPYPVLFVLAAFTGRGQGFLETHPWREGVALSFDRAVAGGSAPPAILVFPDCFTCLGGSQYVNSSYLGPYEDYVARELVPLVDAEYPVLEGRRGIVGKSSGGFGALHLVMRHPGLFAACGSVSGDCCFEYVYASEFLAALRGLVAFDMDPARFLARFAETHDLSGDGHAVLNTLAMAACYSPNPEAPLGFDLPIDLRTGERVDAVWQRWLDFDPLVACHSHTDALRSLELLHLECGLRDEFHLQWGLRRLVDELRRLDVACDHEEHDGGHRGLDPRCARVLPKLARSLSRRA